MKKKVAKVPYEGYTLPKSAEKANLSFDRLVKEIINLEKRSI